MQNSKNEITAGMLVWHEQCGLGKVDEVTGSCYVVDFLFYWPKVKFTFEGFKILDAADVKINIEGIPVDATSREPVGKATAQV